MLSYRVSAGHVQGDNNDRVASLSVATTILALIFSIALPPSGSAEAGSLHALLNGTAIHLESPNTPNMKYNEENWGGGLQYDFEPWHEDWIPLVNMSGFLDSNRNPSYYAGGGLMRRFIITEDYDRLHIDAGIVAFLMTREGYRHNKPFPGILPVLSFGSESVSVNVTYIPKVDPKMVPLFFFQLKVKLLEF